eukprot:1939201-Rhodomonas_salina.1
MQILSTQARAQPAVGRRPLLPVAVARRRRRSLTRNWTGTDAAQAQAPKLLCDFLAGQGLHENRSMRMRSRYELVVLVTDNFKTLTTKSSFPQTRRANGKTRLGNCWIPPSCRRITQMWLSKSAMQAVTRLDAVGRKSMSVSAAVASKKYAVGQGIVKVTRKKGATLRDMGAEAIQKALADAGVDKKEVSALFVGNMMSGMLSDQQHLGPFLATAAGLGSVDTMTTEACCGAGGAALRMAYTALQSGMHDTVVVAGVEQMTHMDREKITKSLATASDWDLEGSRGASFASLNAKLMKLYIETYGIDRSKFAPFALTAHSNALTSEHATLRKPQSEADYESSAILSDPVRILDASPTCDGAAAVVLTTRKDIASNVSGRRQVVLAGSGAGLPQLLHDPATSPAAMLTFAVAGAGSDILAVDHRPEPLKLRAVEKSTEEALKRAGITQGEPAPTTSSVFSAALFFSTRSLFFWRLSRLRKR